MFNLSFPHTLPDRHCALLVSMWPGRFGEEKFGKAMVCFICALSEKLLF